MRRYTASAGARPREATHKIADAFSVNLRTLDLNLVAAARIPSLSPLRLGFFLFHAPHLAEPVQTHQQGNPSVNTLPPCPKCNSALVYEDGSNYVCPECAHEWPREAAAGSDDRPVVRDGNGNVLQDGDTVTMIKDLKVKGSSLTLKVGTKVKSIRLVEGDHNIDCKIDGFGAMQLKSEFVKKA